LAHAHTRLQFDPVALAIVKANGFHAWIVRQRMRQAHSRILPAGKQDERAFRAVCSRFACLDSHDLTSVLPAISGQSARTAREVAKTMHMDDRSEDVIVLYTTWPDGAGAQAAARTLLDERLIACA